MALPLQFLDWPVFGRFPDYEKSTSEACPGARGAISYNLKKSFLNLDLGILGERGAECA